MLLQQPANTWSSFGYVLIGSLMLAMPYDRDSDSALSAISGRTLGVTAIVVGGGSGSLHATLTLWGQFFDVLGTYLVGSFLLVSAIARWRQIPDGTSVVIYALLCLSLVTILIVAPEVRRWLFAVLLILAIVMELVFARRWRPSAKIAFYLWGLAATATAFGSGSWIRMVWSARLTVSSKATPRGTCSVRPRFAFPSTITAASVGTRPFKLSIWQLATHFWSFAASGRNPKSGAAAFGGP